VRELQRGELRAPAVVLDIELNAGHRGDEPPAGDIDVAGYVSAWCLVRRDGVTADARFLDLRGEDSVALADLRERFGPACSPGVAPAFAASAPVEDSLTVVVCTRNRQDGLMMTLNSLARQSDSEFEVVVVDNSGDGALVRSLTGFGGLTLRCVHEPVAGLSRARNRGLAEVRSELVAWIDDDEEADRDWIAWIKGGFATAARPDAVAGVMLPAELETTAQVNFERYGGFNKGRPMHPVVLRAGTESVPDPLYPLPGFGAGGNMAFRTAVLRSIGGFDNRLGAGTLTHGGEETRALSELLQSGSVILHWPPAITWHYHRRGDDALEKQFFGYSAGLTAFFMSTIFSSPRTALRIAGFVPAGLARMRHSDAGDRGDGPPRDFPVNLLRASRRGLLRGAWFYVREAVRQRSPGRVAG
jgi:GT2 family glycosyltransferase